SPELWAELAGSRDCLELAWAGRDAAFAGKAVAAGVLPTLRYRHPIRSLVLARLGGAPGAAGGEAAVLQRNAARNGGGLVMPHRPRAAVAADPANPALFPPAWRCDRLNHHYLKKFLALAASRGIPVVWVIAPYAPPVQALRQRLGQDDAVTRYV